MLSVSKNFLIICLVFASLTSSSFANDSQIEFVGLDAQGKEVSSSMDKNVFESRYTTVIQRFRDSALASLEQSFSEDKSSKWEMKQVYVGASLSASLGLGSLINATASPSFYLILKQ